MMRRWIIAAAVTSCFAASALAQDNARYRQPTAPQARDAQRPPQARQPSSLPRYYDASVLPAAAQSPREAAQRRTRKAPSHSGGSFFSKLHLPNLLPKSLRSNDDDRDDELGEAPLPYDPAEVNPQPRSNRAVPQRGSSARQPVAGGRRPTAGSAPAAGAHAMPQAAPTTSRIARSSPPVSHRRNELADALAGLSDAKSTAEPPAAEDLAVEAPGVEQVVPPADADEALPSYLQGSKPSAAATATTSPRRAVEAPLDVRDALLGPVSPSESPQDPPEVSATTNAPPDNSARLGAIPAPEASDSARQEPVADQASPPAASPTPASASAKAAFGSIEPEAPNPAFEVEPPAPDAPAPAPESAVPTPAADAKPAAVLSSTAQPVIVSDIAGPQQIVVGKQAEYRITVENRGAAAALQLVGTIVAPDGAEVVDAIATNGVVERGEADAAAGPALGNIRWQLYELPAGARQTLTLQLIPRSGRELNLGVQWVHAPVLAQATVVIQEPKLQMEIAGPAEVLFGASQRYALTISNPGNGSAEEVSIELMPPGGSKDSVVKHKVGALAAGESKKIELELTAREAGELKIQAAASAAGNLHADAVKTVMCRKPELQVDWRGPDKQYAGAVATYYIRVRNPGTAAAEQVGVQMILPPGAELVQASDGHAWDAQRRTLVWKTSALKSGEERFMELQCRMTQAGVNRLELTAQTAAGDLSDAKTVPVMIEALADLKLEVVDPRGVVPVGAEALYEIHITNRGTNVARGVNVVGMFSAGIEPTQVEGAQHTMRDGRVTFRTIDSLAAGSETVLKIKAKASQAGTHVFRAEVACDELEAKLAAEETTRFFDDQQRWADASTAYSEEAAGTQTR
ncbi:MAG: DUF11 domain-containing protein [Pirellulales bacterium]|nr:DUF11 domain-containing protein [Pirellulales bacterium]